MVRSMFHHASYSGYMSCHIAFHRGPDTSVEHSTRLVYRLRTLTKVPFMSLTASASPQIESEIVDSVGLINLVFVKNLINRAIIYCCVIKKSSMTVSMPKCSIRKIPRVCQKLWFFVEQKLLQQRCICFFVKQHPHQML